MATVAPPADRINHTEATDMMKKLSIETPPKALEIPDTTKKASVDSSNGTNAQTPSYERSMTPFLQDFMDPAVGYIPNYHSGYYYGGYDGAAKEWDDYARYANPEGADLSQGLFGDNSGLMYPHWYPYAPYSPAGSPVPTMGQDGQLYGSQQYQYPFYQPLNATSPPFNPTPTAKGDKSAPAAADKTVSLTMETATGNAKNVVNGGSVKGLNSSGATKQTYPNSTFNSGSSYGFPDPWFGFDAMRPTMPWFDPSLFPSGQQRTVTNGSLGSSVSNGKNGLSSKNQNYRTQSPFVGFQPRPMSGLNSNGYMNNMYPNKYNNYGGAFRSSFPYGSNCYDSRNGRGWLAVDNKYKSKGRSLYGGYGSDNVDGLNELNRGPRAKNNNKNQKGGFTPAALAVKGQTIPLSVTADEEKENIKTSAVPDREQYNKADFPETYADAKFYIIKSYSEDDIHKSIKYSVWASTPNGNKKLDAAYQEAQQKSGDCPVFLFFSVNTSGQFVGVAEMAGPVDFHKNFEYWQQDKWNGFFPVKWHIVKDVSNSLLKHITLEYNENKPVTNSRDTQEVKLEQGLQMLKIFKDHSSKTCILEDFPFYEGRQKAIQEKKAKQQQFQKLTPGKPTTDEKNKDAGVNGEVKPEKSLEPTADSGKEANTVPTPANGSVAKVLDNGSVTKLDALKGGLKSTAVSEAKIAANEVVNGVVANGV